MQVQENSHEPQTKHGLSHTELQAQLHDTEQTHWKCKPEYKLFLVSKIITALILKKVRNVSMKKVSCYSTFSFFEPCFTTLLDKAKCR